MCGIMTDEKKMVLRHPTNLKERQHMEDVYPSYKAEMRNVRLGLTSDGSNTFCNINHSTRPVILVVQFASMDVYQATILYDTSTHSRSKPARKLY